MLQKYCAFLPQPFSHKVAGAEVLSVGEERREGEGAREEKKKTFD